MSQFFRNGFDLDNSAEPATVGDFGSNISPTLFFRGMSEYARPNPETHLARATITLPFTVNGEPVVVAQKGYKPRPTLRYTFTSPGTYFITLGVQDGTGLPCFIVWAADAVSKIAQVVVPGITPNYVLIAGVSGGGGGGGGQGGVVSGNQSGGGGGGGAKFIAYARLQYTTPANGLKVVVGSGGGTSAGGNGEAGSPTTLSMPGQTMIQTGWASYGSSSGSGGAGAGVVSHTPTAFMGILASVSGGSGGGRSTPGSSCPAITEDFSPDPWSLTIPLGAGGGNQTESGGGPGGGGGSQGSGGRGLVDTNGEAGSAPGGGGGGGDDRGLFAADTRGGAGARGEVRIYY